ncbi:Hypothetical protein R9X50_00225800 [Acrodontium crateriforme]|uniref:Major facilitator superfamily (MFS) profile domain-containing protein n=1 Tax=Acrodontium crateriforme TaxID=150365 RepID=A0AAQ3R8U0_9PEZI|nr:Hypothetical protein R9X50_00225800 [Acrodontium crateriforme]
MRRHRPDENRRTMDRLDSRPSTAATGPANEVTSVIYERIEAPVTFKAYLMCAFAAFAGTLFGYDSGYIASVMAMPEFIRLYGHASSGTDHVKPHVGSDFVTGGYEYYTWEKSLTVSILSAGTFFGALFSGFLADRYGRRSTIIAGCGIFMVGVVVQVGAVEFAALILGRLIGGLGVGFVSAINVLYMSEVAPRKVRGAIVACYQFAITIGIMLASCVSYATKDRKDTGAFRIPIAMQFIWAATLAVGLFMLPESPRYYVKKGRLDRAMKALARVRGQPHDSEYVQDELAEIQCNFEYEQQVGEIGWHDCFTGGLSNRNSNMRKIFIGVGLQMFQQFTGINFIFYYNTTFFNQVGILNPFLISMITTVVNVVSTPISFYTIERFGRRPLLIWGALTMCMCEFVVAIVGTVKPDSQTANWVLIVFVCIYVFIFAMSWGPSAWVVVGEIFQLPIRAKGVAMSTASNWFWNCIISVVTPFIVDGKKGLGVKVFFVWGATCFTCAIFAYFFVPETKSLTLEQVDRMMEEVTARNSGKWRSHDLFVHELSFQRPVEEVISKTESRTTIRPL